MEGTSDARTGGNVVQLNTRHTHRQTYLKVEKGKNRIYKLTVYIGEVDKKKGKVCGI